MKANTPYAMSFEEIARSLHISADAAERMFEDAMYKMRRNTPPELRENILRYLRELDGKYQQGWG